MFIVILIIILLVLFFLMRKDDNNESENLDEIVMELSGMITVLQKFANDPYWKDEAGHVMIIPVNSAGELYAQDSDRLQVSILLFEDDLYKINLFTQNNEIVSRFKLVYRFDSYSYIATTYCTFKSHYKSFMRKLNCLVKIRMPDINFTFDGSRLTIDRINK